MTLNLRLFGHPFVELDGQPVQLETRKALAMLVYLALASQPVSREILATLLWPEFDQTQAQSNLRRNLSSLAKRLHQVLTADRQIVFFKESASLHIDTQDFKQKIKATADHKHDRIEDCETCLETLEKTIKVYRGEFMEGFNLPDCPEFDDWQYQQRQAYQQEYHWALVTHLHQWIAMHQWNKGILIARRLVALDNLDEVSQRRLIWLYAMDNQRTAAMQQYHVCSQTIKKELNQEPELETTQLYESIRDGNPVAPEEFHGLHESQIEKRQAGLKQSSPPNRNHHIITLLQTKLYIPALRKRTINRPHLIARLNQGVQGALTLISAPAGFGKTTLLADWAAQFSSAIGWVSLEPEDNDPVRFVTYLIMGCRSIKPDIGELSLEMLASRQVSTIQTVIIPLLNEISQSNIKFYIVLDDYQAITSIQVQNVVSFIIEHFCPNLHLLIATRADPFLPLARLRIRNQLTDLRAEDLRFSIKEAGEFLNSDMGLNLSMQDIAVLGERTEGWIAGLQMAALSMSSREDKSTFIQQFGGSHHYIMEYLVDEVLSQQPEIIHDFLVNTSILSRLCGSLCDALTGNSNGHEMLEELENRNLFIVTLDDENHWYRYHHLFAQLLRSRAEKLLGETKIKVLHRKASSWYRDQQMLEEAVFHGITAQDYLLVACLIEENTQKILAHGDYDLALKWIGFIPPVMLDSRPWLQVFQAHLFGILNRTQEMMPILDKLERHIKLKPEDNEMVTINAHISYLRAIAAYRDTDFERALDYALLALQQAKGDDLEFQNNLLMLLGSIQLDLGKFTEATRLFSELTKKVTNNYGFSEVRLIFSAMLNLADIHVLQGELRKAEETYNRAHNIALQYGDANYHTTGRIYISLGNIKYEQNELEAARAYTQKGIDHYQKWGHASDMAFSYASLAKILHALGADFEARDAITKALDETNHSSAGIKAINYVRRQLYRMMLMKGDISWTDRWLRDQKFHSGDEINIGNEEDQILRARVLFLQKKFSAATSLLDRLAEAPQVGHRNGALLEIFILRALVELSQNQIENSFSWLYRALCIAEPEGYIRIFIDEGDLMRGLLQKFHSAIDAGKMLVDNTEILSGFVADLLGSFSVDQGRTDKPDNLSILEPLTTREMEILELICRGLSNREIAGKLFISNSTVKTHLHHIFEKICVESRAQLIVRSKELNLL